MSAYGLTVDLTNAAQVASLVQATVVIIGVGFAMTQIRLIQRARHLETIKMVFEGFHDREGYVERQRILAAGRVDVDSLTPEAFLTCMRTADYFQRIGFLTNHGFISRKYVIGMYSGTTISCWRCLQPFVRHMRKEVGLSNYSADFETLVGEAIRFRERKFPNENLRFASLAQLSEVNEHEALTNTLDEQVNLTRATSLDDGPPER
jgi:hypothetical protein